MKLGKNTFGDAMITCEWKISRKSNKKEGQDTKSFFYDLSTCHFVLIVLLAPKSFEICTLIYIKLGNKKGKYRIGSKNDANAFVTEGLKTSFFTSQKVYSFSSLIFICRYNPWQR